MGAGQRRSAGIYPSHELRSFFAVKVYGPGHIIAHNAIAYFHDGICVTTYGTPEDDPDRHASSIDIYNNDIHLSNDDFIESDGGTHNIRVFQNRGVNTATTVTAPNRCLAARCTFTATCSITYPAAPSSSAPQRGDLSLS